MGKCHQENKDFTSNPPPRVKSLGFTQRGSPQKTHPSWKCPPPEHISEVVQQHPLKFRLLDYCCCWSKCRHQDRRLDAIQPRSAKKPLANRFEVGDMTKDCRIALSISIKILSMSDHGEMISKPSRIGPLLMSKNQLPNARFRRLRWSWPRSKMQVLETIEFASRLINWSRIESRNHWDKQLTHGCTFWINISKGLWRFACSCIKVSVCTCTCTYLYIYTFSYCTCILCVHIYIYTYYVLSEIASKATQNPAVTKPFLGETRVALEGTTMYNCCWLCIPLRGMMPISCLVLCTVGCFQS